MRFESQGSGIDAAIDLFQSGYNGNTFAAETSDRPFFYRHTARGDDDMTLRSTRFDGHVTGSIAPGDDYVVSWMTSGLGHFDVGREDSYLGLGQPMVFTTDRPFAFDFTDVRQQLVHFRRGALEQIATEHFAGAPGSLHLDHGSSPDPGAIRSWRSTIALVARVSGEVDTSPILQSEMTRVAAIALLGMFPPSTRELPAPLLLPRNASIRVAVEFVHANAHLPITTTTIASAAQLSIRALQEGFRRHLDTTPNGYLRAVRLDHARAELAASTPGSVALIARRWGFGNLGRFAAAFAERFGEHPGDTARR